MRFLNKLMETIIGNKEVPKVQVERELGPILDIFIHEIINTMSISNNIFEKGKYISVGSEFPLPIDTTRRSFNIDYLFFNQTNKQLYFIELKTDINSFNIKQYIRYKKLIKKINDKKSAQHLIVFLKKLNNKKYVNYVEKVMELSIPWEDIEKATLIYIVPSTLKEKQLENKKKNKNMNKDNMISKELAQINFKDLPKNLLESNFNNEWNIVREHLVKLDS